MKKKRPLLPHDFDDLEDEFMRGLDKISKEFKIINQCPVCNTRFSAGSSRLLADKGEGHLVHLNCKKCLNSVVAVIRFEPHGITSMGMVTDLTYDDVLRIKDGEPVGVDDIIEAHEMLGEPDWQKYLTAN